MKKSYYRNDMETSNFLLEVAGRRRVESVGDITCVPRYGTRLVFYLVSREQMDEVFFFEDRRFFWFLEILDRIPVSYDLIWEERDEVSHIEMDSINLGIINFWIQDLRELRSVSDVVHPFPVYRDFVGLVYVSRNPPELLELGDNYSWLVNILNRSVCRYSLTWYEADVEDVVYVTDEYLQVLAEALNRSMHSLHGNIKYRLILGSELYDISKPDHFDAKLTRLGARYNLSSDKIFQLCTTVFITKYLRSTSMKNLHTKLYGSKLLEARLSFLRSQFYHFNKGKTMFAEVNKFILKRYKFFLTRIDFEQRDTWPTDFKITMSQSFFSDFLAGLKAVADLGKLYKSTNEMIESLHCAAMEKIKAALDFFGFTEHGETFIKVAVGFFLGLACAGVYYAVKDLNLAKTLIEFFTGYEVVIPSTEAELQAQGDLPSFFLSLAALFVFDKRTPFTGKLSTAGRSMGVIRMIIDNIKVFIDWCYKKISGKMFFGDDEVPYCVDVLNRVVEFLDMENVEDLVVTNHKIAAQCINLQYELRLVRLSLLRDEVIPHGVKHMLNTATTSLEKLYRKALGGSKLIHERACPEFIYLGGAPKQGKSTLMKFILSGVHHLIRTDDDLKNLSPHFEEPFNNTMLYNRSSGEKFWEGYHNQWAVTYNEIFAQNDPALKEITASELLRAVEESAFSLNRAFEHKGTSFFTSEMVIASANNWDFDNIGLKQPQAFRRRISFPLEVVRKEDVIYDRSGNPTNLKTAWEITFCPTGFSGTGDNLGLADLELNKTYDVLEIIQAVYKNYRDKRLKHSLTKVLSSVKWEDFLKRPAIPENMNLDEDEVISDDFFIDEEGDVGGIRAHLFASSDSDDGSGTGLSMINTIVDNRPKGKEKIAASQMFGRARSFFWPSKPVENGGGGKVSKEGIFSLLNKSAVQKPNHFECDGMRSCYNCGHARIEHNVWHEHYEPCDKFKPNIIGQCMTCNFGALTHHRYDQIHKVIRVVRPERKACGLFVPSKYCICGELLESHGPVPLKGSFCQGGKIHFIDGGEGVCGVCRATPAHHRGCQGLLASLADFVMTAYLSYYCTTRAFLIFRKGLDYVVDKVYGLLFGKELEEPIMEMQTLYSKFRDRIKEAPIVEGTSQSGFLQGRTVFFEKILKNVFDCVLKGLSGEAMSKIFMITPMVGVFPLHALRAVDSPHALIIKRLTSDVVYNFNTIQVRYPDKDRDMVVFTFKSTVPAVSNLSKNIMSAPLDVIKSPVRLVNMEQEGKRSSFFCYSGDAKYMRTPLRASAVTSDKTIDTTMSGYYLMPGGKGVSGMCASPCVSVDSRHQDACIFGIHIARCGNDSIVCPIYASDFTTAEMQCIWLPGKRAEFSEDTKTVGPPGTEPWFQPLYSTTVVKKTQYVKSPLYKYLPDEWNLTRPAILEKIGEYSPLKKAHKYNQFPPMPGPNILFQLSETRPELLFEGLVAPCTSVYKMTPFDVALFGDDEQGSLEASSSSGYPYVQKHYRPLKRDWFDPITKQYDIELRNRVETRINLMKKGVFFDQIVVDQLKDELRSNATTDEKDLASAKARLFCIVEMEGTIATKMVFGDFIAKTKLHRAQGSGAVGTNPHNIDWAIMASKVFKFGRKTVIGGDLSSQDFSTRRFMLVVAMSFFSWYYTLEKHSEDWWLIFSALQTIMTSVHVVQDVAYRSDQGNSSGNWLTTFFNVLTTWTYLACGWYALRPQTCDLRFTEGASIIVYGDDNLGSVRNDCGWYNNVSLGVYFEKEFGVKYTNPNKQAFTTPYLEEKDFVFLSRTFVERGGVVHAPLSLESLTGMLFWVRAKNDHEARDLVLQNIDQFMQEMVHFSEDEANEMIEILLRACRLASISVIDRTPEYRHCRMKAYLTADSQFAGGRAQNEPEFCKNLHFVNVMLQNSVLAVTEVVKTGLDSTPSPVKLCASENLEFGIDQPQKDRAELGRESLTVTSDFEKIQSVSLEREVFYAKRETPAPLHREIFLQNISFNGTTSTIIHPLGLLLTAPQLTPYMTGYKYVRSGVRLRFVLASSPSYYGNYVISWLPQGPISVTGYNAFNRDPILMSISEQNCMEMILPWTSPFEAAVLPYDITERNYRVEIKELCLGSLDSGSTAPVLSVFAQLYQPQFIGAVSQSGVAVMDRSEFGSFLDSSSGREMVPYEAPRNREMVPYSPMDGTMVKFEEAGGLALGALSVIAPEVAPLAAVATLTFDFAKWGYEAIVSAYNRFSGVEQPIDRVSEEPEAYKVSTVGNVSGCIYGPALMMSSHRPEVVPPFHVGDKFYRHRVRDLVRLPTLRKVTTLTSASTAPIEVVFEPLCDKNNYPSYIDHWANCFRFWRGSIRVVLRFITSPLISGTIRIYALHQKGVAVGANPTYYAYQKIVNVRGTVDVPLLIPFTSNVLWNPVVAQTGNPTNKSTNLYVQIVSGPTTAGSNSGSIFMIPMISAGPDFQFKGLCSPIAQSQMRVCQEWEKMEFENVLFGSEPKLLTRLYEDNLTCEEMSMRYSNRPITVPLGTLSPTTTIVGDAKNLELFDFIMQSFRYVRGSFRTKIPAIGIAGALILKSRNRNFLTRSYPPATTLDGPLLGDGIASNSSEAGGGNALYEMEIPYESSTDWIWTRRMHQPAANFIDTAPFSTNVSNLTEQFVAAGQDYQLAFLMPPFAEGQYSCYLSA